jgi:glutathione S-transferase
MTYILHHIRNSRSMRVLWLMEEMGLDYALNAKTGPGLKSADYLALNPLGTVPLLEFDGGSMLESGAIVQFLLAKHGHAPLLPAVDDPLFAPYLQWSHFAEGTLTPWVLQYMVNTKLKPAEARSEAAAIEARGRVQALLDYMGWILDSRDYIAGSYFTAADIMVGHTLHVASLFGLLEQAPASVTAYFARVSARPAFGRAAAS